MLAPEEYATEEVQYSPPPPPVMLVEAPPPVPLPPPPIASIVMFVPLVVACQVTEAVQNSRICEPTTTFGQTVVTAPLEFKGKKNPWAPASAPQSKTKVRTVDFLTRSSPGSWQHNLCRRK
jgi:hypothetical protein